MLSFTMHIMVRKIRDRLSIWHRKGRFTLAQYDSYTWIGPLGNGIIRILNKLVVIMYCNMGLPNVTSVTLNGILKGTKYTTMMEFGSSYHLYQFIPKDLLVGLGKCGGKYPLMYNYFIYMIMDAL